MKHIGVYKTLATILTLTPLSAFSIPVIDVSRFVETEVTTMDTRTGLEWLDLTQTTGRSYFNVVDRTKKGGQYEGYRYATSGEVSELFDVFQLPIFVSTENPEGAELFMNLFGITNIYVPPGAGIGIENISSTGFVEPGSMLEREFPSVPSYGVSVVHRGSGYSEVLVQRGSTSYNVALSYKGFASFLVRDHGEVRAVPEIDSAPAPMALGLLLFTFLMRWEQRRQA